MGVCVQVACASARLAVAACTWLFQLLCEQADLVQWLTCPPAEGGCCKELLNTSEVLQVPWQAVSLRFDMSQYKVTSNHLNTL